MRRLSISKDGYRLLAQIYDGDKLISERLYLDRRAGVTWPSLYTPGYFCIFGLYDEPEPRRLRLLKEFTSDDRSELTTKLTAWCQHLSCQWILADLSDEFAPYERALHNLWRSRRVQGLQLIDVSDISGLVRARPTIDDMVKRGLVRMGRKSVLYGQGLSMSPDAIGTRDGVKPEQTWYAVSSLGHILCSYDHWPFRKPSEMKPRPNLGERAGYG